MLFRSADLHAVIDRINTGSFVVGCVISECVFLMKPVFRNLRYPLKKSAGKESRDGIIGRRGISRSRGFEVSGNPRMPEPFIISEVLA